MPTVLREEGFTFMIYVDDHEPMHVHARYQGSKAVIVIEDELYVRDNQGMNRRNLSRAVTIAQENLRVLTDAWRDIYG